MGILLPDLRSALRALARRPALTLAVAFILALGIGAATAMASVLNAALLKPLPYRDSDRLVVIWGNFLRLGMERMRAKPSEYIEYRDHARSFSEVALYQNQDFTLAGEPEPERILGARVSASLFPLLGAAAASGRTIQAEDDQPGRERIVLLSHALWQRRFGGDPQIVGQEIRLGSEGYLVVGIMPAGFEFPHPSYPFAARAELWTPLVFTAEQAAGRGSWEFNAIARLKEGVTIESAQAEMDAMGRSFEERYPGYRGPNGEDGGWRITVASLKEEIAGSSRRPLIILLGMAGLLLLAACANAATLLLLRGSARRREFAVRAALGASRRQLIRQLLVESAMLSLFGGAAGLLIASWSVDLLIALNPEQVPRLAEAGIDPLTFIFAFALTLATGLLCGLLPAWGVTRPAGIYEALRSGASSAGASIAGARRARLRGALVVAEIALAVCTLVGAGLLGRSLARIERVDTGFDRHGLLAVELALPPLQYAGAPQIADFYQRLMARLETLPGVASAGMSAIRPLSGVAIDDPFSIEGRPLDPENMTVAGRHSVSPGTFRTLGLPLRRGRDFTAADAEGAPVVAIINERLARRFFAGEDAIGKRIKLGGPRAPTAWAEIVGIAGDIPHRAIGSEPQPEWYLPHAQAPARRMHILLRPTVDPVSLAPLVRREIAAIDRDLPVVSLRTLDDAVGETLAPRRFNVLLAALFACAALALSAAGVSSLVSSSVAERRREIGVRIALGAEARDMRTMFIREGMKIALLGISAGLLAALALSRLMTSLLYGVSPADPMTYGGIAAMISAIVLAASYLPARRAARVDPMTALRQE